MDPAASAWLPLRPALRPGFALTRRDEEHLQIGVDPPHRVILDDTAEVRALLRALERGTGLAELPGLSGAQHRVLSRLLEADLVVDHEVPPAMAASYGLDAGPRLARTRGAAVTVLGDADPEACVPLERHGVRVRITDEPPYPLCEPSDGPSDGTQGHRSDLWLVIVRGEPARSWSDDLVRAGLPHLFLGIVAGAVRIGPFVVPGRTACLRCLDAAYLDSDARRPLVLEQQARIARQRPSPVDPLLWRWGLCWATRDVLRHLEGATPSTWSATVDLGSEPAPSPRQHRRHPHCGCTWDLELAG